MPLNISAILLVGSLIILVAIFFTKVGNRFGVPALLIFLFTGILFGEDGLGISFNDAGMAQDLGVIALSIILFTGGMDTKFSVIRRVMGPGVVLSTLGVLLTTLFTGLFIYFASQKLYAAISLSLSISMLMAATMSSTDSASVFALLRSQRVHLKENLKPLLELESGSNDPMAYMLTIMLIGYIRNEFDGVGNIVLTFVYQFAVGLALGALFGLGSAWIINKIKLPNRTLYSTLVLGFLFLCYALCDLIGANGFLATYIFGITLGNRKIVYRNFINNFFDGVTWLLQIVLFLMLGLLVNAKDMINSAGLAVMVGIFMMLVGRPLAVFLSLLPFRKISLRAKTFTSWIGLRGAAPIIFATYPVVSAIPGANIIFEIVFFITLLSLLLQGMTITPVAKMLRLAEPAPPEGSFVGVEIPEEYGAAMEERKVTPEMLVHGNHIRDIALDDQDLIVLVRRNDDFIVPKGDVEIFADDMLLIVSPGDNEQSDSGSSFFSKLRSGQR